MSCHDIGRGMNSVVKVVMDLLEGEKVSKESARRIIAACRKGVNWCDGNEYEAVASIRRCVCGRCLNIVPEGKFLFSVLNVSTKVPNCFDILDRKENLLASDGLCEECFDRVINEYCNDTTAAARERKYIIDHCRENEYLSEGIIRKH